MSTYHQKLSQQLLNVKPEQTPDRAQHKLHHQVDSVVIKWTQIGQHIDVHQAQLMVLIRLVLLDQDLLQWNLEEDSGEDKQNKYEVSFATSRRRSDYIFFFFDSKIHLF